LQQVGQTLRVGGWVKTGRAANKDAFAFLELNDGSTPVNLQARPSRGAALRPAFLLGLCAFVIAASVAHARAPAAPSAPAAPRCARLRVACGRAMRRSGRSRP